MSNYKLLLVVIFSMAACSTDLHAQDPHRRDTIPFAAWKTEVLRVPVLTGGSQPIIIVPTREPFCFDKKFSIKLAVGSRIVQRTMYLDSRGGISGTLPPASGTPVESILPDQSGFSFGVMSLKGNIFVYKTQRGRMNSLEHWVSTGNTQTFEYQAATPAGAANLALSRKNETRVFCDGKLTGQAYRLDGGANTWYVYGDRYPEKLHPIQGKYFGQMGVGYVVTQEGTYLVLEREIGSMDCRVSSIENVRQCFDPTQFKVKEESFNSNRAAELDNAKASEAREEAQIKGDCVGEKTELLNYKKELTRIQEENLRRSKLGNYYQDSSAQRAMLGMMDPLQSVRIGILSDKVGICEARTTLSRSDVSEASKRAAQIKISCLGRHMSALQALESRMQALDQQYSRNMAQALAEKSRAYTQGMRDMESCQ